ncbi:uncharacterized protein PV07_06959 [Cladophialophora immunda]|uniref:Uncharacterized protein n=1 Tax=Cladophialophora immunda TaxID=569365 RepID=A0A0D2CUA1_9EURO|nr:uncharacterized protein PV07_06959 [Cladophialophora immunda]KIW27199.1 hypothetical protein PV07_06959 [Cladophialophora immunda]OQV02061.1 hypothetical protein CLAIMM_07316 [Cladophialophora immunda]
MGSLKYAYLLRRDGSDFTDGGPPYSMNQLLFVLFTLVLMAALCSLALVYLRRRRLASQRGTLLPTHHQTSHHRSPSISHFGRQDKNESIFVYDEKMNLIHNSSSPPSAAVPEIHITFPDEEGKSGLQKGRVVVVHVTDSGSVGMEPLTQENLPPYQKEDGERFQSLDLERIGGLREKEPLSQRFS